MPPDQTPLLLEETSGTRLGNRSVFILHKYVDPASGLVCFDLHKLLTHYSHTVLTHGV